MTILVEIYKRALADKTLGPEKALILLSDNLNSALKNISGVMSAQFILPPIGIMH